MAKNLSNEHMMGRQESAKRNITPPRYAPSSSNGKAPSSPRRQFEGRPRGSKPKY